MKFGGMRRAILISTVVISLLATYCATGKPRYQYQRTVPGADGTVYVQGIKVQPKLFLFNSTSPVIWNCKLRGEDLKCDRELLLNIDPQYSQNEVTNFEVLSSKDNKFVYRIDGLDNGIFSTRPVLGLICVSDSKGDLTCK